jgi:hypothetical protein
VEETEIPEIIVTSEENSVASPVVESPQPYRPTLPPVPPPVKNPYKGMNRLISSKSNQVDVPKIPEISKKVDENHYMHLNELQSQIKPNEDPYMKMDIPDEFTYDEIGAVGGSTGRLIGSRSFDDRTIRKPFTLNRRYNDDEDNNSDYMRMNEAPHGNFFKI